MSKLSTSFKSTIGILDTADYTNDELYGGSTGYIKTILPYMASQDVFIVGQGINGTTPWKPIALSNKITFIPVADFKYPSKIPLRLLAFFFYALHRKRILNLGMDVLYIHSPEICLPFLFFNKKIPVIYHQHGFSNTLHSSKYPYGEAKIFRKFFDVALWLIHKKASWIIAIDPEGLKQSDKNGVRNKTSLLLNAVNTSHFKPNYSVRNDIRKHFGLTDEDFVIINTGRIEKQKGLQRLLACIPLLKSEGLRFHIFIVGDGSYKRNLEDLVKSYQGGKEVTFLGRISHEQLPDYYNMSDLFVLPSEKEGVPMAILEAMSCGTPAVANAVGGIPNLIENEVNGILLKNLSIETISSSIIDVHSCKYDRQKVAKTVESLGSKNAVSHLNSIIDDLITNKKL